ncbi:MAG: hypothetical protein ACM3NQ_20310 [Bacteroidales bacterium]
MQCPTCNVLGSCTLVADVMSKFFAEVARFLGALRTTRAEIGWGASSSESCARLLDVRVTALHHYLRADDPALGSARHLYLIPIFRNMSRLLEAELPARR